MRHSEYLPNLVQYPQPLLYRRSYTEDPGIHYPLSGADSNPAADYDYRPDSISHHTEPYSTLIDNRSSSLYPDSADHQCWLDRKSTRLNSSHVAISYAVFCL